VLKNAALVAAFLFLDSKINTGRLAMIAASLSERVASLNSVRDTGRFISLEEEKRKGRDLFRSITCVGLGDPLSHNQTK